MDNIIAWLRRNSDEVEWVDSNFFYGTYLGHKIRYHSSGKLDVGHKDFDRWANSRAYSTTVTNNNIQKQISKAVIQAADNKNKPAWYTTMRVINKIFQ